MSFRGVCSRALSLSKNSLKGIGSDLRCTVPSVSRLFSTTFYNSDVSYKTLPDETAYIIDASGLMFQTHHSPYRSLTSRQSEFNEKFRASMDPALTPEMLKNSCATLVDIANNFVDFIKQVNPQYVAVVFDSGKTFRNELFPGYKAQRKETPPELAPLFWATPIIFQALGINLFMIPGFEADDVMATLGKWFRTSGLNVVHVSDDQDMLQLVSPGVHTMNRRTKKLFGEADVTSKFGVKPSQLCDLRALSGDKADNIAGVKGVGLKAGASLVRHFGSVEELAAFMQQNLKTGGVSEAVPDQLAHALKDVRISKTNINKSLSDQQTMAQSVMFKQILTLREDVALPGITSPKADDDVVLPTNTDFRTHMDGLNGLPNSKQCRFVSHARAALQAGRLLTTNDFRFRGEEDDAEVALAAISPDLVPVLNKLRTHYAKMNLAFGRDDNVVQKQQ